MSTCFAVLFAAAFLAVGSERHVEPASAPPPIIAIEVRELADISPVLLLQAEDHVSRIFADVGIDIRFQPCRPRIEGAVREVQLVIRETPAVDRGRALAFARPFAEGGVQVEVFLSRVEPLLAIRPVYSSRILAHVIAHEIGHLLTRIPSHRKDGMMKANFEREDLRKMAMSYLRFEPLDLAAMQMTLEQWARSARSASVAGDRHSTVNGERGSGDKRSGAGS